MNPMAKVCRQYRVVKKHNQHVSANIKLIWLPLGGNKGLSTQRRTALAHGGTHLILANAPMMRKEPGDYENWC